MTNIVGPALSWRLVHDGASIVSLAESAGYTETQYDIFEAATEAACYAEAARLGLPLPAVPEIVTMKQARLALLGAGLLESANATIAALPGALGDAARIKWEYSSTVERHGDLLLAIAATLNLSSATIDALFVTAAAL